MPFFMPSTGVWLRETVTGRQGYKQQAWRKGSSPPQAPFVSSDETLILAFCMKLATCGLSITAKLGKNMKSCDQYVSPKRAHSNARGQCTLRKGSNKKTLPPLHPAPYFQILSLPAAI